MTNSELDRMFANARNTPAETSIQEVTGWVSAAATAVLGTGLLAKLKVILLKKTIIMISSTLITGGIIVGAIALNSINSNKTIEKTVHESKLEQHDESPTMDEKLESGELKPSVQQNNAVNPKTTVPLRLPISPVQPIDNARSLQLVSPPPFAKKQLPVNYFHSVDIDGIYDVVIKQGASSKVEVELDGILAEFTDYVVKDGVLCTECSEALKKQIGKKGTLHITLASDIQRIHHAGVGDLNGEGLIKAATFELKTSGVGDIKLHLECADLKLNFSGVGDIQLTGASARGNLSYFGVGDFNGYDFIVDSLVVDHFGVGDVHVHATQSIEINANGVGNVAYKGDPAEKKLGNNGIGKIKHK